MNIKKFTVAAIISIYGFWFAGNAFAQSCDLKATDTRRTQTTIIKDPYSFVVHVTMKRGASYTGTAFFIHPRVLLTAGHCVRKRPEIIFTRVKKLTLRFGATDANTNLFQMEFKTTQDDNIYTLSSFNDHYSIYEDYGIIILPDETAYNKIGGKFTLTVFDQSKIAGKFIKLAGYPGDRPAYTQWQDSTQNYFVFKGYLHYDFGTEEGASGAPVWFDDGPEKKVFAIHTNGHGFDQYPCNTGTLITKVVYDDIVRFCLNKGINITK